MNLSHKMRALVLNQTAGEAEARRGSIKLAAALCAARTRIGSLEAETMGQREALLALNRHAGIARDFASVREAEREACARLVEKLGFVEAASRIRERK